MTRAFHTASPPRVARTRWLLFTALGLMLVGCGDSSNNPVSAGAGRDAPANTDATSDADPAEDRGPDLPEPDAAEEPRTDPVDRILRQGAVGTITLVTDGDTVHVTIDGWYHRVRMQGISAPECLKTLTSTADGRQYICSSDDEYWGLAAGEALEERAFGATVTVTCDVPTGQACAIDDFDRPLAFLADERGDLGEWMARNGHALSFTRFSSANRALYCEAEDEARAAQRGMWALGDRDEVLAGMNDNTRDWYQQRDQRCAEATQ